MKERRGRRDPHVLAYYQAMDGPTVVGAQLLLLLLLLALAVRIQFQYALSIMHGECEGEWQVGRQVEGGWCAGVRGCRESEHQSLEP